MKAEIITIGDEILIGQIVDTNSQWIGQELNKIGVAVYQISSIQDERQHILTGGLGPTKDDITKKTLAEYFKDSVIVEYPEVIQNIERILKKVNHPFNKVQKYQAQLPSKATMLMNRFGTAPGMWFYENNTVFISLPGVPYEMKGLITNEVLPRLEKEFKLPVIIHKTIMTYGTGESVIAERIVDWEEALPTHIKLAYLPSFGRVRLRLSAKGNNREVLEQEIEQKIIELNEYITDITLGLEEGDSIEKSVGRLLTINNKTLCTAESMTGGKIASTIVSVPGSSAYYQGSYITYNVSLKEKLLDVPKEVIINNSSVSFDVAKAMAVNARKKLKTDYSIAVTGNAGPTTDNNDIDIGVVYIAIANGDKVDVKKFDFGQPREKVINRTVTKALELLQRNILEN